MWATTVARASTCAMSVPKRARLFDEDILEEFQHPLSSDDEDYAEGESDDGEDDNLETEVHILDEEEVGNEDNIEPTEDIDVTQIDDDEEDTPLGNLYFSRDKDKRVIKWRKFVNPQSVRTRSCNIIVRLPGPKGDAKNTKSAIECFNLFFDPTVIRMIVSSTNIYIAHVRNRFLRERDARDTDETEVRAFIGILILSGALGSGRKQTKNIWDNSKGTGVESCYLAMSQNRFHFLMRCLRFDDIRDRPQRRELDRLAAVREMFELVVNNFQRFFVPSAYCTVDEQLVKFKGRCPFRMYMPDKPARYGIKIYALCCAKTMYAVNLEIYPGQQPNGPYKVSTSSMDVTIRMCEPVAGTNRNITTDNWFTSIPLAETLLEEKKLTLVGTIKSTRVGVPTDLRPNKGRQPNSSLFAHQNNKTLVSYCPKRNKAVVLLSTMHVNDQSIDLDSGEKQKPEIVTLYNKTKVGVDVLDQMCAKYDVARNTKRWPMVVFFDLVNIAAINGSRIQTFNNKDSIDAKPQSRRKFLECLAWDLIKPQIQQRIELPSLPAELKRRARRLLGIDEIPRQPLPQDNKVGRCFLCGRARDKSSRKSCQLCGYKVCQEHSSVICRSCFDNK